MNCQILTDKLLSKILSKLWLREKSRLIRVSNQFRVVINGQISSVKHLEIFLTDNKTALKCKNKLDIIFSGKPILDSNQRQTTHFDIKQIKQNYHKLLKKFKNLKSVLLELICVNRQLFQWINELFPKIQIYLSIRSVKHMNWTLEDIKLVELYFGSRIISIAFGNVSSKLIEAISKTDLFLTKNLYRLVFRYCISAEKMTQVFLRLPQTIEIFWFIVESEGMGLTKEKLDIILDRIGNSLKVLVIDVNQDTDDQHMFDSICDMCPALIELNFNCNQLKSMERIKELKNLTKFEISVRTSMYFNLKSISNPVLKLNISGLLTMYPDYLTDFKYTLIRFPIRKINCENGSDEICSVCYQKFFNLSFRELNKSKVKLKNEIIFVSDTDSLQRNKIILSSVLDEFLKSGYNYSLDLIDYGFDAFIDFVIDLILLCARKERRPHIIIKDNGVYLKVLEYKNLFPEDLPLNQKDYELEETYILVNSFPIITFSGKYKNQISIKLS